MAEPNQEDVDRRDAQNAGGREESYKMAAWNFGDVKAVVAVPGSQVRQNVHNMLAQNGLSDIFDSGEYGSAAQRFTRAPVDLMVCDNGFMDAESNTLVRNVRHQLCGHNPFVVVVSLVDVDDKEELASSVGAGPDGLVAKPFTPKQLTDRIWSLARNRKPFVVTADYIGPTRRSAPREGTEHIPEFEVPNPVRAMALDGDREKLNREIEEAAHYVNDLKLERNAVQIRFLAEKLIAALRIPEERAISFSHIRRLGRMTDDIARRAANHHEVDTAELCSLMHLCLDRLTDSLPHGTPEAIEALQRLTDGFTLAFCEAGHA